MVIFNVAMLVTRGLEGQKPGIMNMKRDGNFHMASHGDSPARRLIAGGNFM